MKRFWFAIAGLAALLGLCIVCTCMVSRCTADMIQYVSQAKTFSEQGDYPAAAEYAAAAAAYWDDHEAVLDAFQQHSEIDQLGMDLEQLLIYGQVENREEFPALCGEILRQLQHIHAMELPLLQNIL